ncbi:MAG: carboxypeptidase regulatory-like domain-containing protein, partial [Candidatus Hadarchaeaceae archaeon]
LTNEDLKYARWTGTSWEIQTVDSEGDVGDFTSIALDSGDNPHISYFDRGDFDLEYARWTGTSWEIQTVDNEGVGAFASIALDFSGNPHISYYDVTNDDLKYSKLVAETPLMVYVGVVGVAVIAVILGISLALRKRWAPRFESKTATGCRNSW